MANGAWRTKTARRIECRRRPAPGVGATRAPQTGAWLAVHLWKDAFRSVALTLSTLAEAERRPPAAARSAAYFQLTGRAVRQHKPHRKPPRPARGVFVRET